MPRVAESPESGSLRQRLDDERLLDWLRGQRWFASKSQSLTGIEILEEADLDQGLALTLAQVQFATGGHELYQILLAKSDGELRVNALAEPANAHALLDAINANRELEAAHGRFYFRSVGGGDGWPTDPVRGIGAEQSNSSIVFGERLVLKLYRKLESGINPELEMLRFLTARDYAHVPALHGWCEYEGAALAATLAVVQHYVEDGVDGWELALDEIPSAPDTFLERLVALGSATAKLHSLLATDATDPAFSPEETSTESLSLLRATLDDQLEHVFNHLPDDPAVAPIADLEQEIRQLLAAPSLPVGGRRIRIHGDYHLGQTLHTPRGWTLLDFEGEPARPLIDRRAKRSPLRDIASMLRSFSYATWAIELQRGLRAPESFERRAREAFLGAYLSEVDPMLLPSGQAQIANMLAIFELEKALYELQYELNNRPDWVPIPVAGIGRLVNPDDQPPPRVSADR
jgi:maltokinase